MLAMCTLAFPSVAWAEDGTISPNPIDLGNVNVGGVSEETLTFTNTSGGDVTVTGISVDTAAFALSTPSSGTACDSNPTISDSLTCTENISFLPTQGGPETGTLTISFSDTTTVTAPVSGNGVSVHITSTSVRPSVFYPLVRDGFKDFTVYSFKLDQTASGTVQVFNHKGTLTRSFPFSNRNRFAVAWGGRNRLGAKVKPGYYRFRVVAHASGAQATSGFARVQVRTGFRLETTTGSKSHRGIDWASRSTGAFSFGGNCNWGRLTGGGLLTTCLFAHAAVNYTFELPRGAKVTGFTHTVSSGVAPCRHALWKTTHLGRIHHATFAHGSVNGFSQCAIGTLTMRYKVTRKIRI
jgi:hypothetical protein